MPAVFDFSSQPHLLSPYRKHSCLFRQCYHTSCIEKPFLNVFGINCLLTIMAQLLRKNPIPDDYLTAPDDYESAGPEFSTATGKKIQFRVPLWSNRKLVDEEQGHHAPSIQ